MRFLKRGGKIRTCRKHLLRNMKRGERLHEKKESPGKGKWRDEIGNHDHIQTDEGNRYIQGGGGPGISSRA